MEDGAPLQSAGHAQVIQYVKMLLQLLVSECLGSISARVSADGNTPDLRSPTSSQNIVSEPDPRTRKEGLVNLHT